MWVGGWGGVKTSSQINDLSKLYQHYITCYKIQMLSKFMYFVAILHTFRGIRPPNLVKYFPKSYQKTKAPLQPNFKQLMMRTLISWLLSFFVSEQNDLNASTDSESTWRALNCGDGAGGGVPGEGGGGGHPVEQRPGLPFHRVVLHVIGRAETRYHLVIWMSSHLWKLSSSSVTSTWSTWSTSSGSALRRLFPSTNAQVGQAVFMVFWLHVLPAQLHTFGSAI